MAVASCVSDPRSRSSVSLGKPKIKTLRPKVSLASSSLTSSSGMVRKATSPSPKPEASPFVHQNGPFRLTLNSEQYSSSGRPVYSTGEVISGCLDVSRTSSLRSIELKVTGKMSILELAGNGSFESAMFSHIFYEWDKDIDSHTPDNVRLNYSIPSKYIDDNTGGLHDLPPSYKAQLKGIPGFKVQVSYEVTAVLVRSKQNPLPWKRVTKMHIPFTYRPVYCAERGDDIPSDWRLKRTGSHPQRTQKLFSHTLQPRVPGPNPIQTQLILPFGQICVLDEAISFIIKVSGTDDVLDRFEGSVQLGSNGKDTFSSFHPMDDPEPRFSTSSLLPKPKPAPTLFKIRLELQRTTTVDAKTAELIAMIEGGSMSAPVILTEGVIQSKMRGLDSIAWSGQIMIPPDVICGGFSAGNLSVHDNIVLTISSARNDFLPLCEYVPLKLTARTMKHQQTKPNDLELYPSSPTDSSASSTKSSSPDGDESFF